MSLRTMPADRLQFSGLPRVFLLPDEVARTKKAKATRALLTRLLLLAVLLVAAGVAFAQLQAAGAAAQLAAEQARTSALIAEQTKYSEVIAAQASIASITSAQQTVTASEVVWAPVIQSVQNSVPADVIITGISAVLPDATLAASPDPLAPEHAASVAFTAVGPQESISSWLAKLTSVDKVVAVAPGSVTLVPDTGLYAANVTLLFSADVLSNRFVPKG